MQELDAPENPNPIIYDVVGILPATDRTPDIYYCADKSSEKVAALTFLTLWFLHPSILRVVKQRTEVIICGLSPASGGSRLEKIFKNSSEVTNLSKKEDMYDYGTTANDYAGTCHYPRWAEHVLVKKGFIAVYATSSGEDERMGYTARWRSKFKEAQSGFTVPPEDVLHQFIYYGRPDELGVHMIADAFRLPESERDGHLAAILRDHFSEINILYDMVPKRTTHEVAHLLEHDFLLGLTHDLAEEIKGKIDQRNSMLRHYAHPREAAAELAGISMLSQVRKNAGLDFGIPTTMLDKVLEVAANYIDEQINAFCLSSHPLSTIDREPC